MNTLAWWKFHEPEFPILAGIAREYYCVPATSASSERAFSQAGLVVGPKRTKLNIQTIEKLCFVNQNFYLLEPFVKEWKYTSDTEIVEPRSESQPPDEDEDDNYPEPLEVEAPDAQDLIGPSMPWTPYRDRATPRGKGPGPSKRSKPDDEPQAGPSGSDTPKRPRK